MFRTVPLPIISLYTQQWYMSYRFTDGLRAGSGWNAVPSWSFSQAVSIPVWHISLLCVQWKTPDDGQRNCPKHVEFHSKNKFEKFSASSWFYYKKRRRVCFSILYVYRKCMRKHPALARFISVVCVLNTTGRCCPNSWHFSVWNAFFWLKIGPDRGDNSSGSSATCT